MPKTQLSKSLEELLDTTGGLITDLDDLKLTYAQKEKILKKLKLPEDAIAKAIRPDDIFSTVEVVPDIKNSALFKSLNPQGQSEVLKLAAKSPDGRLFAAVDLGEDGVVHANIENLKGATREAY